MTTLPAVSDAFPLYPPYFPAPCFALIFRNFGVVPTASIARSLQTDEESVRQVAALMGLSGEAQDERFLTRGFLTIIRENWHLTDYAGICALLDISEERLAFILKEDDFFWVKVGYMKPNAPRAVLTPPDDATRAKLRAIAAMLQDTPLASLKENAFDFLAGFHTPVSPDEIICSPRGDLRLIYSYFALYGDPLLHPELDPYPDALLQEYAKLHVNGIWMQGILYQLVPHALCPEISKDCEKRIEALNALCERAARFGIGVYLYFNEPRSLPATFFDTHAGLRGTNGDEHYKTLCTSVQEVQEYLENATHTLFTQVPSLAGYFTITRSENPTTCFSHDVAPCPHCAPRGAATIISEVNNLLYRGAKRAKNDVRALAWTWGWKKEWAPDAIAMLDSGITVMNTSETAIETNIGGVRGEVIDYSISQVGPGKLARGLWDCAQKSGLSCAAKIQLNNSWELSSVPYLPVFSLIRSHALRLKDAGVSHLMLSWTLGGAPSPNLLLVNRFLETGEELETFLESYYGKDASVVNRAQEDFCRAFVQFPFDLCVLYFSPLQLGAAAPIYRTKTGYAASMTGFPYDNLKKWGNIYSGKILERQFSLLCDAWEEGLQKLDTIESATPETRSLAHIARAAFAHFCATRNQIRFILARDASDTTAILSALDAEESALFSLAQERQIDSRIGFEAANHYFYTMRSLQEKYLNIQDCRAFFAAQKEGQK